MTDLESRIFLIAYICSNVVAIFMLISAIYWPRIARSLFCLLFAWACWINWKTSVTTPEVYLDYADAAFSNVYKTFINGWFSRNVTLMVGFIATCQGLIAFSILMKGGIYKTGCIGGITFLVAILPLGFYAAFPCTLIMAIAMYCMLKRESNYIWIKRDKMTVA